ncbi:hypothetical protein GCM10009122_44790 [Fulvivirga kasyanovii]|uniref:Uncharacterized protein n=1 Tax=Fulvivirga kasyanovii TaxID=396812 RepID=A0ABW9RJH0_9BACT|nr:hypothetical protein [Fulvivirga kasyanovii]MTI24224.1 hypothetical protein [Fulvivirga kasyanovii]
MKQRDGVIFLIDSDSYDRNMLSLALEKITRYKVFNFFSMEECLLYWGLKPKLLIYDSVSLSSIPPQIRENLNLIDISKDLAKQQCHKLKDTRIAQEVAYMLGLSMRIEE